MYAQEKHSTCRTQYSLQFVLAVSNICWWFQNLDSMGKGGHKVLMDCHVYYCLGFSHNCPFSIGQGLQEMKSCSIMYGSTFQPSLVIIHVLA